jgi:malate dehydrogenase (oxaloacetate-decarboxylating)(NADP+)
MDTGVARKPITDWDAYKHQLQERMGRDNKLINFIMEAASNNPKRVLFGQAENLKVLKAVQTVKHDGIAVPVLMGNPANIRKIIAEMELDLTGVEIVDPRSDKETTRVEEFATEFVRNRNRKGITHDEALELMRNQSYFGAMMVNAGEADAFLSGTSSKYASSIKPAIECVGVRPVLNHIAGMYIMMTKKGPYFFADTTVNRQPDAHTLVDTTLLAAEEIRKFNIEPVIALVSYSNFGTQRVGSPAIVAEAVKILHEQYPEMIVDGEMQANFALNKEIRMQKFPFSKLADRDVNTLIFPNLDAGNIAYKMVQELSAADVIGPIVMGMNKPIHVLQMESSVREIIYMAAIAAIDAQCSEG